MKKITALCVLGCVLVFSAFAQLNIGGYAKTWITPYRLTVPEEGENIHSSAVQANWGEQNISAGLNVDAHSNYGGFHLGFEVKGGMDPSAAALGWV